MAYEPRKIERKWQRLWRSKEAYRVPDESQRKKFYILDMFPYPSGYGLHVGHLKGYVGSDVIARYRRMLGFNVLHPMGWDSFGLPTERQAEKDGISPQEVTNRNVQVFRKQLDLVGLSYDWSRAFATSDADYYKWTQWIFLRLVERGLAYQAELPVNWCPALGTVLANEEVKDGTYVETGDPVEVRVMRQWMLRITEYADRLLEGLELVDWPQDVKRLQQNWIGRSKGTRITFSVEAREDSFDVFTTRPDTLFGASYCVLAPEHPLVERIATEGQRAALKAYVEEARNLPDRERTDEGRVKSGVFTGAQAINPANGARVPIWVADYVLMHYGFGAIMAVPAHDQRDWEFSKRYGLPLLEVVEGGDVAISAFQGDGPHKNSEFLDGLGVADASVRMTEWLEEKGVGEETVTYRLRDWLFSRQRYWGEPIPLIHGPNDEIEAEPDLPLVLPDLREEALGARSDDAPRAPLESAPAWLHTVLPGSGKPGVRETNVMPQWAGSCWYYLRFIDPANDAEFCSERLEKLWMPVDLYVGGIEHATLHLLYARFWHKVLYDLGLVSTKEPFTRLFNQGKVQARSFRDSRGRYYHPDEVEERDGCWYAWGSTEALDSRVEKMSKSRYNVVAPEPIVEEFGADSLRFYEVFMGPLENNVVWQTDGLTGMRRFLERAWRLYEQVRVARAADLSENLERVLHQTVQKVTNDLENLRLNTAVSQLMIFANEALRDDETPAVPTSAFNTFVRLLAPFAPHLAEEMWEGLGNHGLVLDAPWPSFDPETCIEDTVTVAVQVNGRLRANLQVARGASEDAVMSQARELPAIERWLDGRVVARTIYVSDRILNLVVR